MNNSDAKVVAIVSYITFIGWVVALILNSNNRSELGGFHLRQSLGLMLSIAICWWIPVLGWLLNIVFFVFWLLGLIYAIQGEQKPVPLVGDFYQNIFKGIN